MADEWDAILEEADVEITDGLETSSFAEGVEVEVPAGFGRNNYERMVEDLWSDGEVRAMTVLDRSLDFLGEASAVVGESLQEMYETTASGEFDGDKYAIGIFGTGLGLAGIGMAAASLPIVKAGKAVSHNIQTPGYTSSSTVYDNGAEIGEQESTRVFYTEGPEGRSLRFTGPLDEAPDAEIVEQGIEYLENF